MRNRFLKTFVTFVFALSLFFPVQSFAVVPLMGVAFATLGAIISMTALTGGYAVMVTQGIFPDTTKTGHAGSESLGRDAIVQWVDTKDVDPSGLPQVKQKSLTVKAPYDEMRSKIGDPTTASGQKYPALSRALYSNNVEPLTEQNAKSRSVGEYVSYNGFTLRVNQVITYDSFSGYSPPQWSDTYSQVAFSTDPITTGPNAGWYNSKTIIKWSKVTAPPYQAKPNQLVAPALTDPSTGTIFSDQTGDIDQYIKDYPGSVSVVEGPASSVDTAPAAVLPTPGTQTGASSAEKSAAATAAAGTAASSANNAVTTAQSNYAANPTPDNKKLVDDAIAARDKLVAEQAKDAANKATQDAATEDQKTAVSGSGFKTDKYGDGRTDDQLSLGNRFKTFFDQMKTTAVFSLPNQFMTNIPTSSVSSISFDGGRFGQQTYDFAVFASLWSTLKAVILVAFGWFAIRIAILKGGSG